MCFIERAIQMIYTAWLGAEDLDPILIAAGSRYLAIDAALHHFSKFKDIDVESLIVSEVDFDDYGVIDQRDLF